MSYLHPAGPAIDLAVNLGHVAALRDAGRSGAPDLGRIALQAIEAGAACVVLPGWLQDVEIARIAALVPVRLMLETDAASIARAVSLRPDQVLLDRVDADALARLAAAGIDVMLTIDAQPAQAEAAAAAGLRLVEIRARDFASGDAAAAERLRDTVNAAARAGLSVCVGQSLDNASAAALAAMPDVAGLHIGHTIAARAMDAGWTAAVRDMAALLVKARLNPSGEGLPA